jgi:hypothetical protein
VLISLVYVSLICNFSVVSHNCVCYLQHFFLLGNVVHGLSKKHPAIFFPPVSKGERVGKLSVVVEGTFMLMHDFLLPHNTTGCVCRFQIAD